MKLSCCSLSVKTFTVWFTADLPLLPWQSQKSSKNGADGEAVDRRIAAICVQPSTETCMWIKCCNPQPFQSLTHMNESNLIHWSVMNMHQDSSLTTTTTTTTTHINKQQQQQQPQQTNKSNQPTNSKPTNSHSNHAIVAPAIQPTHLPHHWRAQTPTHCGCLAEPVTNQPTYPQTERTNPITNCKPTNQPTNPLLDH